MVFVIIGLCFIPAIILVLSIPIVVASKYMRDWE